MLPSRKIQTLLIKFWSTEESWGPFWRVSFHENAVRTITCGIPSQMASNAEMFVCNITDMALFQLIMSDVPLNLDSSLQWCYNGCDGVSNHQPHDCLLNRLFMRRSKKTSKLRVTGLCAGNSPVTGEFPAQMASNAEMFPFDEVIWEI